MIPPIRSGLALSMARIQISESQASVLFFG
jgi:hypothetical protein